MRRGSHYRPASQGATKHTALAARRRVTKLHIAVIDTFHPLGSGPDRHTRRSVTASPQSSGACQPALPSVLLARFPFDIPCSFLLWHPYTRKITISPNRCAFVPPKGLLLLAHGRVLTRRDPLYLAATAQARLGLCTLIHSVVRHTASAAACALPCGGAGLAMAPQTQRRRSGLGDEPPSNRHVTTFVGLTWDRITLTWRWAPAAHGAAQWGTRRPTARLSRGAPIRRGGQAPPARGRP